MLLLGADIYRLDSCFHFSSNDSLLPASAAEGSYQLPPDDQQVVRENLLESMIRSGDILGKGSSEEGRHNEVDFPSAAGT